MRSKAFSSTAALSDSKTAAEYPILVPIYAFVIVQKRVASQAVVSCARFVSGFWLLQLRHHPSVPYDTTTIAPFVTTKATCFSTSATTSSPVLTPFQLPFANWPCIGRRYRQQLNRSARLHLDALYLLRRTSHSLPFYDSRGSRRQAIRRYFSMMFAQCTCSSFCILLAYFWATE